MPSRGVYFEEPDTDRLAPGLPGPPSTQAGFAGLSVNRKTAQESAPAAMPKPIEIRKTFPETWIFDNLNFDSK